MNLRAAATRLIRDLVTTEALELRRPAGVAVDLADWVDELGRVPSGVEFDDWLEEHKLVTEVLASDSTLNDALAESFGPLFETPAATTVARHHELESEIQRAPNDPDTYLVYADWLQEQGDPLGELIVLNLAADGGTVGIKKKFQLYLKKHQKQLFADLSSSVAKIITGANFDLKWRFGFVHKVRIIHALTLGEFKDVLLSRAFLALQKASLNLTSSSAYLGALLDEAPCTLSELSLHAVSNDDLEKLSLPSSVRTLRLHGQRLVWPESWPELDALTVDFHQLEFGDKPHECQIKELELTWNPAALVLLAKLGLSKVERLCIDLGGEEAHLSALVKQMDRQMPKALTSFEVKNGVIRPDVMRRLVRAAARGPRTLAFTNLGLGDEMVDIFTEQRESLSAVTGLNLSHNEFTREGLKAASDLGIAITSSRQNSKGSARRAHIRKFGGTRFGVAEGLADAKKWKRLATDGELYWGEYYGTELYELFVERDLSDYGCSCPSSDLPCKHVVALALIAAQQTLEARKWHGRVRSQVTRWNRPPEKL